MSEDRSTAALFRRYGGTVHRRCCQLLGEERADDALQEVFLRVHRAQGSFRGESSPLTWLYRIATTYCLQELRNHNLRARKLELIKAEASPSRSAPGRSSGLLDRLEVRELLTDLGEDEQMIVLARHVEGMTMEEIAELAGVSRKTVLKKLERFKAAAQAKRAIEEQA